MDRSYSKIKKFQTENFKPDLTEEEKVKGMELLEIQRQAMLMYTSCGWFFSEISGIETVQIMKYAARAMQLAASFSSENYEEKFLEILSQAKSNIAEHGTGRDIYEKFVKPSVVTLKQIACLWAISSLYQDFEDEESVYCYSIKRNDFQKVQKNNSTFIVGNIEIRSKVTLQKSNLVFALMQYSGGDFHCSIKEFSTNDEYQNLKTTLIKTFMFNPLTEIIRTLDEKFGKEYFTLKDIFIEERKKILQILLKDQLKRFGNAYKEMFEQGRGSIYHMQNLGLEIPKEFKISAAYALSQRYNDLLEHTDGFVERTIVQQIIDINTEAKKMDIEIDKTPSNKTFAKKIIQNLNRLTKSFEIQQADAILELFEIISKLELQIDISEAQNIYYNKIYHRIGDIIENNLDSPKDKDIKFIDMLLNIGINLNINVDFYKVKLDKLNLFSKKD